MTKAGAALVIASIFLAGCASQVIDEAPYKSYQVGSDITASVGGVILEAHTGTVQKVKHWVGLLNAPGGWKIDTVYSDDYVSKELLYSGISGNTIKLTYREFRGGLAAPAFYQTVEYDLSKSADVVFQNFEFDIVAANNSSITATLLHD